MAKVFAELLSEASPDSPLLKGMYEAKQKKGKSDRKRFEKDPYTEDQNFLYNRALYGLSVYTEEEIKTMNPQKRNRIKAVHKRAQICINRWKQEIIIALSDSFFKNRFPDSPITKELLECPECRAIDDSFRCRLTFKSLKITKAMVIERLIRDGILPKDFNHLNQL